MARAGWSVAITLLFLISFTPSTVADCAHPPQDCRMLLGIISASVPVGEAEVEVGAYKGTTGDHQDSGSTTDSQSDGADGFEEGHSAGILIIVNAAVNTSWLEITFDNLPSGYTWANESSINITDPIAGGHYVLPFDTFVAGTGLLVDFTVVNNHGESATATVGSLPTPEVVGGELQPPPEEPGLSIWMWVLIGIGALLVIKLVFGKRR